MDIAESHRNQNNVGIANMKQVTVADQFIVDHQEQHKLSQVLMNQTPDIRPGEREEENKNTTEKKRQEVATREGPVIACELGVLFGRLGILSSQIISSLMFYYLLFFSLLSSSFLFSSALFSYCRLPVFPSLPFFDSFVG